jgi:Flp pilus assembly pilin Flp
MNRKDFTMMIVPRKRRASKGQSLTEYALILALIAVVCVVGLQSLGGSISTQLNKLSTAISSAGG